jgi:hypothetical protein
MSPAESEPQPPEDAEPPAGEVRRRVLTDARTMRALAHPIRLALIDMLMIEPALTATEAAEQLQESPSACSFHLRQLAKYGFVEEATAGTGRARPWRLIPEALSVSTVQEDPEAAVAAGALAKRYRDRQSARLQHYLETSASYPTEWQEAATSSGSRIWMTAAELRAFAEQLTTTFMEKFRDRSDEPGRRPKGALPVEILLHAFPTTPPKEDDQS